MGPNSKYIEVSKILDAKPEIFSLPASIIVPVMFISVSVGMICYILQLSGFMGLLVVCVLLALHFFLFGREWWRLVVKFNSPPNWVRYDILAVPFSLNHESKDKTRKLQSARTKKT